MEPQPPAASAGSSPQFEFDKQQSAIIGDLANSLRWVAAPLIFLGVLYILAAISMIFRAIEQPEIWLHFGFVVLIAILLLTLGKWTTVAAESFQRVVSTTGQDIPFLMVALDNLRKMYAVLSTLVKVYVAIVLIGLIVMIVSLVMLWMKG